MSGLTDEQHAADSGHRPRLLARRIQCSELMVGRKAMIKAVGRSPVSRSVGRRPLASGKYLLDVDCALEAPRTHASSPAAAALSRGSLHTRRHLHARRGARRTRRLDAIRLGRRRRRDRRRHRPLRRPPRSRSRGERRARTCVRVRACGHMCGRRRRRMPPLLLRRCPGHAPGSPTIYPRRLPRRRRPKCRVRTVPLWPAA